MMSTMTTFAAPLLSPTHSHHSHSSCGKARANSDDYNVDRSGVDGNADNLNNCNSPVSQGSKFHYDAYSLQRAMSSEARLPSRGELPQPNKLHEQAHFHGGTNEEEEDELQYYPSDGDGLTFSSSNETDEVDGSATHLNRYGIQESGSCSHRITPSPRCKKMPPHLQQRQQPKRSASPFGLISRSVSDTTHSGRSTGSAAKQILLQTIESRNNATTKPKPLPRTNGIVSISSNNSSATGSSSPDHKYHPPHHQPQHSNVSFTSHYSVDAGKHGFLSHSPPPSPPPRLHSFSNGDDDSAAGGAGIGGGDANSVVSNGSLVFKYLPGQETPPAEYALPVSILKVYGDSLVDEIDHHHLMNSSSKDIIPPVRRKVLDEFLLKGNENQQRQEESNTTTASSMISSSRSELPLPPPITILEDTTTTSGALPSLREEQHRILPYHERKRLSELLVEKEKQRRQKKNAATTANVRNQQQANSKTNGGMVPSASENTPLNGVTSGGYGGTTPLMASNNNNGNNDVEHGGGNDNVANHVIHPKDTKEWFGQLVSIITGKSAFNINDAGENKDPKQTYRDQAAAFLKKTESERMKIKELSSAKQKNLDRSWAKRSSISAALDSIPSCSGEEEEEVETDDDDDNDTNETYSSSEEEEDEEYGSYYFDNRKGGGTNPSATMASGLNATPKVWSYGEPPITIDRSNSNASLMKKLAAPKKHHHMSEHDLKMRRDRLLQEEYEYRLRALQREHANLSKKFRIFVLVTVAIIFTGALTFAFVVCVRMLMSIK